MKRDGALFCLPERAIESFPEEWRAGTEEALMEVKAFLADFDRDDGLVEFPVALLAGCRVDWEDCF